MISETRRSFLSMSLGSIAALGTGAAGYGVYRLFTPDTVDAAQRIDMSDVDAGSYANITLGPREAVVFNDRDDGLTAYILACTRAGCPLELTDIGEGKPNFWTCTCDGSTFALTGEALKGPAIHPLRRIAAKFENGVMIVPPALGQVTRL